MTTAAKFFKKILIAEDDPVSRHVLKAFLVKWDFDVTVATDGRQALRILESEDTPRLAVLDWMMPGMEGVEICQRLRKNTDRPYIYILLLTARSKKQDLLQGLNFGADDYLTKPFDAQELRARLQVGERILGLQDELRFQATHDALTGIENRAAIIGALQNELSRQVRQKGPFGIILGDIDLFKKINDTYGHLSGDAVLRAVAQQLKDCTRPYDSVGRYGGEEFLVVAPGSDSSGTMVLAERIRKAIESQPVVTDQATVAVTMSLGVAVSTDPKRTNAKMLLQLADDALYRAKEHGRNRSELGISPELVNSELPANENIQDKAALIIPIGS
jgi:two-component system, cell cycle response regulator